MVALKLVSGTFGGFVTFITSGCSVKTHLRHQLTGTKTEIESSNNLKLNANWLINTLE